MARPFWCRYGRFCHQLADIQDPGDLFEFVCDPSINKPTATTFELTIYQCMYERKFRKSHEEASDDDIEALKDRGLSGVSPGPSPTSSPAHKQLIAATAAPAAQNAPEELELLFDVTAELYLYDAVSEQFVLQDNAVSAKVVKTAKYTFWLTVENPSRKWLGQPVESEMNATFNNEHSSFIWNYHEESGRAYSWLLRFGDKAAETTFREGFGKAMWETLNEASWEKTKADEQQYMLTAYQDDVEMEDAEGSERSEADESEEESETDDDDKGEELISTKTEGNSAFNSQLAVGYKHDRSFVVRGDQIGVFKHTDDDRLQFATTINKIQTPGGKSFNPEKVMLHEEDSAMVLMDPNNKHAAYKMDLEYGKVVEEWQLNENVPVRNLVADNKYAQMTAEKTLVGMSHNALFRIDPRLSGSKVVDSQFKQYATKNDFSSAVTTDKGHLAVASNKGDIRLYDSLGKIAKTALPALGDPIIGIDVTANGKFIVATCKTYLLLIDTEIKDGNYKGQYGFTRSFAKDSKPTPRRLQLRPEHVAYMDTPISFTPARFNTGIDEDEKTIVTSTGPYVVTWNFRRVKSGKLDDYQIKKYADNVVADNFKFGADRNIIVTLPNDVVGLSRTQLKKPSRSSIVHEI